MKFYLGLIFYFFFDINFNDSKKFNKVINDLSNKEFYLGFDLFYKLVGQS